MIRVDRSTHPAPSVLLSPAVDAAYQEAERYFASDEPRAKQVEFKFEEQRALYGDRSVREALNELFAGKCAFCESYVGVSAVAIMHHFRPKQEAVSVDGDVSRPHYWWLAYEWDNLYQSCQRCATSAGARFPVRGRRAVVRARGKTLRSREKALLVDPCWDDPDEHLIFDDEGVVAPRTPKGEHTIDVYNLNRAALVDARRAAISDALNAARVQLELSAPGGLEPLLSPTRQYAAAVRQAISRFTEARGERQPWSEFEPKVRISPAETLAAVEMLRQRPVAPLEIERVEIRDFRNIEHLQIRFADREAEMPSIPELDELEERGLLDEPEAEWTMLLGENGHGKTSVLYAVALVLMGTEARRRLKLNVDSWIRHGANVAEIVVHVRNALEPRVLRLIRDTGRWATVGDDTPASLAAYGAGRMPPLRDIGRLPRRYRVRPRVENLFDPHTDLMPARGWLLSLDEETFDFAARALRRLVLEPETTLVERVPPDVVLRRPDGPVALEQLSDGYRSMIALAVDLMSVFHMRYGSMDAAEGIVLVDELSAHLHPRWQMRIVRAFREAFPRLQVIATTHDPLCLRGLKDGEVVVLRRTTGGVLYALPPDEVPSLGGLRVDELLTSEVFGLNSTVDEELDAAFARYYRLLAQYDRTAETEREIGSLKRVLDRYRQFGSTRRERLALETADEYVAQERNRVDPDKRRALSDEARSQLLAIWASEAE
jgi:uncharacterized protein (TIGR02646 family)